MVTVGAKQGDAVQIVLVTAPPQTTIDAGFRGSIDVYPTNIT